MPVTTDTPTCYRCDTPADADPECRAMVACGDYDTPADAARDDGTFNPDTNHYACTTCYIAVGMPSSPYGWRAP